MTKAERIMIGAAVRALKADHVEPIWVAAFLEAMLAQDDAVEAAMKRHPAGKAKP